MVEYDYRDRDAYDEQELYRRCSRWTENLIWTIIVGSHVYMIVSGNHPYGCIL
jgi:hypothetical protein